MFGLFTPLTAFIAVTAATPLAIRDDHNNTMATSFKNVPLSADLKYVPCFQNYTCANLEVPLDYDHPDVGTTNIAFIRWNTPKQPAMGDIIFNPGGPGGSGVNFVLNPLELPMLIELLGDAYNIVGMDPRGVNNSGPNLECFAGTPAIRDYFDTELFDVDPRSEASLKKYYQQSGSFGTWCSRTLNDTVRYANTPATARDMLQYAEKLAESQGKPREEAQVNFYGASYGSALGTTFASLFPTRVGRFLIDAVLDVEDYYFGNWSQNLLQADAAVESFFELCASAGPTCALYTNGSTAASIQQRVDAVLQSLEDSPLAVTDPAFVQFPTAVTHADLRGLFMLATYNPPVYFATLALIVAQVESGNGTLLAFATQKGVMPKAECDGVSAEWTDVHPKLIIACNDNNKRWAVTEQSVMELFAFDRGLSKYFGEVWASVIVPQCRNLKFSPPENQVFNGELVLPGLEAMH